jgi:hypothetical protein
MLCAVLALGRQAVAAPWRQRVDMDLRDNVAKVTRHLYIQSYQALQTWLWERGLPPMGWLVAQSVSLVGEVLISYVQFRCDE